MRCAFDNQRLRTGDAKQMDGALVHVDSKGDAVDPPHEVIEGRLLDENGLGLQLPMPIDISRVITH